MHWTPIYLYKWNVKFHEPNEHISSEYYVYWEKLCIHKGQVQLFEEEHAHSDLVATIWDMNKLFLEPGKLISGSIAAQIRDNNIQSFKAHETISGEPCWDWTVFDYFR